MGDERKMHERVKAGVTKERLRRARLKRKVERATIRCLLSLLTLLPSVAPSASTTLYLSPKGSDSNNCSRTQPCLTINGIQSKLVSGDTVMLETGAYILSSSGSSPSGPIFVHGGTSGVTYEAVSGQIPVITGAQRLASPLTSKWSLSSTGGCQGIASCYVAAAPLSSSLVNFEYLLYVPGGQTLASEALLQARRTQSHTVNLAPYPTIVCEVPPGSTGCSTGSDGKCNDRIVVNSSDVPLITSSSHNLHDIRFYNFRNANVDALRISQVNTGYTQTNCSPTKGSGLTELIFTGPGNHWGFLPGLRYMIANSREYFESNALPGSFYLDCGSRACVDSSNLSSASIYYIANKGEHPGSDQIWAPQLSQLISDTPANGVVNSVTFEGIYFVADNFVPASSTGYQSNSSQSLAPAALSFVDTTSVSLSNVVIAHTSGWGLEFRNDNCNNKQSGSCTVTGPSMDNSLSNSVLYDIGTSGLRLGRYPPNDVDSGNTYQNATQNTNVENNLFSGMGRMYPGGEAGCVWIGSSHDNTIENNECSDSYGGGIALGPSVSFTQDYGYNNTVESNLFHDLGEEVIDDFGCAHFANQGGYDYTYNNFPQPLGNRFLYNVCYNITNAQPDSENTKTPAGTGLYIDNNSQGNTVSYNLVFRTSGPLFFNNESPSCINMTSCENTVENNILALSMQGALKRGGFPTGDSLLDFTFSHNVVSFDAQNGPQWQVGGQMGWDCQVGGTGSYAPPCAKYFNLLSNGYWNPNYTAQTIQFFTNSPANSWVELAKWTATNPSGPGEDGPDNGGVAAYSNPLWVDIACSSGTTDYNPATSFHFGSSSTLPATIKFDTTGFAQTYNAGRAGTPALCNPSSSCVAAATFPPAAPVPACNSSSW